MARERRPESRPSHFTVSMEVSAPIGLFARPDTGITPVSYPVPTWSACKGIFESIAFLSSGAAWFAPTQVEICRHREQPRAHLRTMSYATNYGGPERKAAVVKQGSNMQLFATVLTEACYRLYADIRSHQLMVGHNPRHHLYCLFNRRLQQGRCFRTPCLGWSEFTCNYWGPFRDEYEVDRDFNESIPSLPHAVFDRPTGGRYEPSFRQDVSISGGVLRFAD